jgi:hypothetical protein
MTRKGLLVLVLAAFTAIGAFALPEFKLSAGAGGYFTSAFGGGIEEDGEAWFKTPYFGGGGFAFFDATFAEVSVGFFGGGGKNEDFFGDMSFMGLDIGLLGKYPFAISDKLSAFPLLGITYRVVLSVKDEDGEQYTNSDGDNASGDFSALWFKLGGGVDYSFTDAIYLRGEALYGLRLANKVENDWVNESDSAKALLGHGLDIKIAVGYRF